MSKNHLIQISVETIIGIYNMIYQIIIYQDQVGCINSYFHLNYKKLQLVIINRRNNSGEFVYENL